MAVFRNPQDPADELPPHALPLEFQRQFGIEPDSVRVAHQVRASPILVARGSRGYCLIDAAGIVTNCWSTAVVNRGAATVASLCGAGLSPNTIQLAGLVPNKVRNVGIVRGRRVVRTVPVVNNVFVAVLRAGDPLPYYLAYSGPGFEGVRRSTGIPRSMKYERCGASHEIPHRHAPRE